MSATLSDKLLNLARVYNAAVESWADGKPVCTATELDAMADAIDTLESLAIESGIKLDSLYASL